MKLQYATSKVDNTGSLEHRRATIDLNPTIAHVLSRDLYQRPIESMFREITINAIDAHREAGQERPIEIHIPTLWDETFFVRDYGMGLPHDKLMDIYMAYGLSSRRDSDEVHGGFGLGTKSPLAYTSTFSVVSFIDGTKNSYLVYYDEDNLPCVDHRESVSTIEPNGLLVSLVTLNSYDYQTFQDAAKIVLARFPIGSYTIVNNSAAHVLIEQEKSDVYGPLVLKKGTGLGVNMGFVSYSMDTKAVAAYAETKGAMFTFGQDKVKAGLVISTLTSKQKVEIAAQIGDYPMHPSREHINVTPRAMKQLFKDFQAGLDILFSNSDEINIDQDSLRFNITGFLSEEKKNVKVRGRLFDTPSWSRGTIIPPQCNNYFDFIKSLSKEVNYSLCICGLSSTQLTDYLGNGRRDYTVPSELYQQHGRLFVYEKDNVDEQSSFITAIEAKYPYYDLTEDIAKYLENKRQREELYSTHGPVSVKATRASTKLMGDRSHNVLLLNPGATGRNKSSWVSIKHNVMSLKELKKKIFWVPTSQGCIKDLATLNIIDDYNIIAKSLPSWRKPTIIGLPASKGTKMIEGAFSPIEDLPAYTSSIIASDSYKRKQKIKHAVGTYNWRSNELLYAAYGPVNWVLRLEKIFKKYNLFHIQGELDSDLSVKAKEYIKDIQIKLPGTMPTGYYNQIFDDDAARNWAETLAILTNNKPTGAKAKNDPYNLS